jgi:peptidyl-prolyl cis-trans isomerase A (cyclophilin A)
MTTIMYFQFLILVFQSLTCADAFTVSTFHLRFTNIQPLKASQPSHSSSSSSSILSSLVDRRQAVVSTVTTIGTTSFLPILQGDIFAYAAAEEEKVDTENAVTRNTLVEFQICNLQEDGTPLSSGTIRIQLEPDWAPRGVARFQELMSIQFYDQCRFFRVLPGFVAQFGINGNPSIQAKWKVNSIPDDPVRVSNDRGTVVFATAGPNTRTTQLFINTNPKGNGFLDRQGFSPIGKVVEGMDIVDQLYAGYGEGAPSGKGPNQSLIQAKGNSYLEEGYPKLSYICGAKFIS